MDISIIVVAYNHERYIQECLESIKFQVESYNQKHLYKIQVIIADDASIDMTKDKIDLWIKANEGIFDDFIYIKSHENVGTCRNFMNAINCATGKYIKAIGGDDLFPQRSIFKLFSYLDEYDIVYGNPLIYVEDGDNSVSRIQTEIVKNHCNVIEESKLSYYNRIHRYCFFNAPGTFVSRELLTNEEVQKFILSYKLVDDYTLWLKCSELKDIKLKYIPGITVIYRRTSGSTYFVRNKELKAEIARIYTYALNTTRSYCGKIITRNILHSLKSDRASKYINILAYLHRFYYFKNRNKNGIYVDEEIQENLDYIIRIKNVCSIWGDTE